MYHRRKRYLPELPRMGSENCCKGKSVVHVYNSAVPEEAITKTKVFLRINCIDEISNLEGDQVKQQPCTDDVKNVEGEHQPCINGIKNPEGEEKQEDKRRGFVKPRAKYYVSVSLENLLDDQYCYKRTRDRCKFNGRYLIRWALAGIQFDVDFLKIHESVLKLEVIRHYDKGDMNVPYEEVGTSCGTKVVGRAKFPLWDFLQGDLKKTVSADLFSGDENRTKLVQLVKMDGSEYKNQGLVQVYMTVKKVIKPTSTKQKTFRKVLNSTLGWLSALLCRPWFY